MRDYLATVEVRVRVKAANEHQAEMDANFGVCDDATAERLGVEWLGQDVVSCVPDTQPTEME